MNTETRERLAAHLLVDEGVVLHAYQDHLGYWTIGAGRLIDKRKGGGITYSEAMVLLQNDITKHWDGLIARFPWIAELTPARQAAFANLAFNLGVDGLSKFRFTLAAAERGDWNAVGRGLMHSLWYQQVGRKRSERIITLMLTGEFPNA